MVLMAHGETGTWKGEECKSARVEGKGEGEGVRNCTDTRDQLSGKKGGWRRPDFTGRVEMPRGQRRG